MPIAFQKTDLSPTCNFSEWAVIDENHLVRTLAWLYLRKPNHAVQIINQLEPSRAGFPGKVFENAISLLSIRLADIAADLSSADPEKEKTANNKKNKRIEQRDGFPTPYHFAVSRELSTSARIEVQKQYERISKYIEHDPSDDWDAVRTKVTNAMSVSLFQDISEDDIKALTCPPRNPSP